MLREHALTIFEAAIAAVRPDAVMRRHVRIAGDNLTIGEASYDLSQVSRLVAIGAGKASAAMAATLESILGDRLDGGIVVTKYGHSVPCTRIRVLEAGHPVIDDHGLRATGEILDLAQGLTEHDLAIVLISGGGSALLEHLPDTIPLADAQATFGLLLRSGANIAEMNAVRKHISMVKGGQLARALAPCPSVAMIISDVIGDPLDVIASGPTVADSSTYQDAWDTLTKIKLIDQVPTSVSNHLRSGKAGQIPETPKLGEACFQIAQHLIIASNSIALAAAHEKARTLGYHAEILTAAMDGEARDWAEQIVKTAQVCADGRGAITTPACLLYGGEMTVTVRGPGLGGRCQEFAVAALGALRESDADILIAACGTDGTDGPTDAAGGIATLEIAARAKQLGLSVKDCLSENDAYHFLEQVDGLIITGPTGTNVMDICLALVLSTE